ncbi:hypothetical protein NFI96_015374 [Prochilodus magdalenae]|nr:hypothetical protein NFI96_015374 [Prochilodus magdalenae]
MTHPDFTSEGLSKVLLSAGGAFAIIFFFVTFQYIFKLEFICPCEPNENWKVCIVYIGAPFFIFFIIILVVDKIFLEACATRPFCSFCKSCALWKRIGRAFAVSMLWIATVLLDGDCLVCFETTSWNITVRSEQPACKKETTSEEFASIRYFSGISRVYGLGLLLFIIFTWAVGLCFTRKKQRFYKDLYEEYVLDETDNFWNEGLKQHANQEAKNTEEDKLERMIREREATTANTALEESIEE